MSQEPTEELFDTLMKKLNGSKEDIYENSDVENNEGDDIIENSSNEQSKNFSEIVADESESDKIIDKNVNLNTIVHPEENYEPEVRSSLNNSDETVSTSCEPKESINLETEELGVPLDTSNSDFDSMETITIDVDQSNEDDEFLTSSAGEGSNNKEENIPVASSGVKNQDSATPVTPDNQLVLIEETASIEIVENTHKINNSDVKSELSEDDKNKTYQCVEKLRIFSNLLKDGKVGGSLVSSSEDVEESMLGCKSYKCQGCESKFWILRFYYQHLSRETTKILYDCKHCTQKLKFTNPCLLKIHMKSHGDSINNIKLEASNLTTQIPVIEDFKNKYFLEFRHESIEKTLGSNTSLEECTKNKCPQCKKEFSSLVEHLLYRPDSKETFQCRGCDYIFTSYCSFKMHTRLHYNQKPYGCPECGALFITQVRLLYHIHLECYHLRRSVMRKCYLCNIILPNKKAFESHLLLTHRTVIYKCVFCPRTFKFILDLENHVKLTHQYANGKERISSIYDKCEVCSSDERRVFPHLDYNQHLQKHLVEKKNIFYGYRCRKCNYSTLNPVLFQNHMEMMKYCKLFEENKFKQLYPEYILNPKKRKCPEYKDKVLHKKLGSIFSVKKKAKIPQKVKLFDDDTIEGCEEIEESNERDNDAKMMCLLCTKKFQKSNEIRNHILNYHKCEDYHKYVQINCSVKEDVGKAKQISEKNSIDEVIVLEDDIQDTLSCPSCDYTAHSKEDFQNHVVVHREDGAYQCLECGECFVCKNPLEIHLVSVHSIKDTSSYISSHYVHNSLPKPCDTFEELQPNQCSVCFDIFPGEKALQLHFRSHGMAFLRQSFAKKISS